MGEFLQRDPSDPLFVPSGTGMTAEQAKMFQEMATRATQGLPIAPIAVPVPAQAAAVVDPEVLKMAKLTGRSIEEVLAFMKPTAPPQDISVKDPIVSLLVDKEPTPVAKVQPKEVPADGFVVTEVIDPAQATQAELDQAFPEEEENNWDGKIREGSKVRVTYNAPGSRIKWAGKVGTVVRVIGNEKAKVYEVSFKGQKIAKTRLNKATGKLERGFENKKLTTTFDQEDVELYS
jgi:hypothetical protein